MPLLQRLCTHQLHMDGLPGQALVTALHAADPITTAIGPFLSIRDVYSQDGC